MLDRILHLSLANRVAVLIAAALLLVGGTVALVSTEVDIFPDLNAPTVTVMTEAPGFTPEEVERMVTWPVEAAVNGAAGVRRVRSRSAAGFSAVKIEFDWGTDIYRARQTVSEAVALAAAEMPPGAGTPQLGPQSSILGEVMIVGLTSDSLSPRQLRSLADRTLRPRLLALGGVASVAVIGGDVAQYQVLLDPGRMRSRGVTMAQVTAALEGANANSSGASLYAHENEYLVKVELATADTAQLAATPVATGADGMPVTVADIARVELGSASPRLGVASVKAEPAVLLTLTKQPGVATLDLTRRIDSALDDMRHTLPPSVEVSTDIFRQATFIDTSISNLQAALLEGALFVILVLFFFMMDLRATLVSVVALPLSIIVSVLVLRLLGQTINTMSLGGIAIAIGSLVDDAIVDVENVYKRLRQHPSQPRLRVIYEASREVRIPIFNSTLIIIAGFLPLFFLSGFEGRMLIPLGIAFVVALIASTVVALTVTPVLSSYLLKTPRADAPALSRDPWLLRHIKAGYGRSLAWCLRHGRAVIVVTAAMLLLAAGLSFTLGTGFLPPFNEGSFTINVSTMPGISLDESDRLGRLAEQMILEEPEIITTARKTGRAELDEHSFGVNVSEIEAPYRLDHGRSRAELAGVLRHKLAELPGVNVEIGQPVSHRIDAMLSGSKAQVAVKIYGSDLRELYAAGSRAKELMEKVEGVEDVTLEQLVERPQLRIRPRRAVLSKLGVTLPEFSQAVSTALAGTTVSQVYDQGLPYDIVVKADPRHTASIEALRDLPVDTPEGAMPLEALATVEVTSGPDAVSREGASRLITVTANVEGRDLGSAVADMRSELASLSLPEGSRLELGGQFENQKRASRTLAIASVLALALIFMLLYKEYRSASLAAIIMVNMPLAAIGGVLILVVTGTTLNIPAIIGFISLLGISTRNGMLLVSRYRSPGSPGIEASSIDRLAPIVMTALTSALALFPLALQPSAPGNEIQAPMALVILGGLLSSTLLNLFVVPVIYTRYAKSHPLAADGPGHDDGPGAGSPEQ